MLDQELFACDSWQLRWPFQVTLLRFLGLARSPAFIRVLRQIQSLGLPHRQGGEDLVLLLTRHAGLGLALRGFRRVVSLPLAGFNGARPLRTKALLDWLGMRCRVHSIPEQARESALLYLDHLVGDRSAKVAGAALATEHAVLSLT